MEHENNNVNISPLKKQNPRKTAQEKEYKMKRNLQMENHSWNECQFQIYWNIFEWINTKNTSKVNNHFGVSSNIFYLKDTIKTSHWVGHSKIIPLNL